MSVWAEIDQLKRKYDNEFTATENGVEGERAIKGSLHINEYGLWSCRYVPSGERSQETLTAKTGPGLVKELKAIREREVRR